VTKRDDVLWGFTYSEVKPFLKYASREILFREAVIGTLIKEEEGECDKEQKKICEAQFGEFLGWACKSCEKKNGGE